MKKGNKKLFILLALVAIIGAVVFFIPSTIQTDDSQEAAAQDEKPSVEQTTLVKADQQAPQFTVEMLSGESISLESLRGKVVLLNFWATWCPPCREELKRVQADLIERFQGRDFVFLPIARGEKTEVVEAFLKENGYTFDVGIDPEKAIYDLYASNYIPRNFLINRHGVVVEATVGYEPEEFDQLLQLIEMSLNAR